MPTPTCRLDKTGLDGSSFPGARGKQDWGRSLGRAGCRCRAGQAQGMQVAVAHEQGGNSLDSLINPWHPMHKSECGILVPVGVPVQSHAVLQTSPDRLDGSGKKKFCHPEAFVPHLPPSRLPPPASRLPCFPFLSPPRLIHAPFGIQGEAGGNPTSTSILLSLPILLPPIIIIPRGEWPATDAFACHSFPQTSP